MKTALAAIVVAPLIAAAIAAAPSVQTASSEPASRAIALPGTLVNGALSPDGRHYAFLSAGSLVLRDLQTGSDRTILSPSPGDVLQPGVLWSADSGRLLFRAFARTEGQAAAELREVRADGTGSRVVAPKGDYGFRLLDWSRDGLSILFFRTGGQTVLLSLADKTARTLAGDGGARFAPDGRHVVHDRWDPKAETNDLFIANLDGSGDRPLIASPAHESFLGWSPDGGSLLFMKDGDIWVAGVTDGNVQPSPRLLKRGVGSVFPLVVTREGHFYYRALQTPVLFRAPLDSVTGKIAGASRRQNARQLNQWAPAWSADSRELAYKHEDYEGDLAAITVVAIDSSIRRELSPEMQGGIPIGGALSWSRDGRSLLVDGGDGPFSAMWPLGAHKVDASDGEATMVISKQSGTVAVNQVQWLPDSRSVVYLETWRNVVVKALETGDERRLYESAPDGELDSLALSPDGKTVAFRDPTRGLIQVLPITGDVPRTVANIERPDRQNRRGYRATVGWSADGRFVIFSDGKSGGPYDLLRVPVGGGAPEKLGLTVDKPIGDIAVQPNGQSIVVVMSDGEPPGPRVIEHLLPAAGAVR